MRSDIQYLLVERQRRGSGRPSLKTGARLPVGVEYGDDYDSGPRTARCSRGAYGWWPKELNENLRPLYQFLEKSVGRSWNKVYAEIREQVDPRRTIGYHVLQHVGWHVNANAVMVGGVPFSARGFEWHGLWVDPRTGILKRRERRKTVKPAETPRRIRWRGNVWFEREVLRKRAECGCVGFTRADQPEGPYWPLSPESARGPQMVCIHGNPPVEQEIWYVVEYRERREEEVYRVVRYGEADAARYGVTEAGDSHTIYFRDVPEKMKRPVEVGRKAPNKKEMAALRELLGAA